MYGTPGSSTYEETHANIHDSTIKQVIDGWYKTNIEDKNYSSYLSDSLFCNDRSLSSTVPSSFTQLGYSREPTAYGWYAAVNGITITCKQQNDRFTVSDTVTGNGALIYPVGLITTDEAYLAGAYTNDSTTHYLYTGNAYWTMSPVYYNGSRAYMRTVGTNGAANNTTAFAVSVRPVINLKPNSLKSGDGTMSNPYTVEG